MMNEHIKDAFGMAFFLLFQYLNQKIEASMQLKKVSLEKILFLDIETVPASV